MWVGFRKVKNAANNICICISFWHFPGSLESLSLIFRSLSRHLSPLGQLLGCLASGAGIVSLSTDYTFH